MTTIRRATLLSFDTTTWLAQVLLDGAESECQMPAGEWVPAGQLTAGAEVACICFDDTNTDDGVVLGAYGGLWAWTLPSLNLGSASGAPTGSLRAQGTGAVQSQFATATANQSSINIITSVQNWAVLVDLSNAGGSDLSIYDVTNGKLHLQLGTGGATPKIGVLGATAAARQTSGANLSNNVASGGTNDQIDNWTSLTTYSTDAAAIRNAVYQLARKLKQVNDALRLFGFLT